MTKSCATCRRFARDGKQDPNGRETGYCTEYAAPTREDSICHPDVTYIPMDERKGKAEK